MFENAGAPGQAQLEHGLEKTLVISYGAEVHPTHSDWGFRSETRVAHGLLEAWTPDTKQEQCETQGFEHDHGQTQGCSLQLGNPQICRV